MATYTSTIQRHQAAASQSPLHTLPSSSSARSSTTTNLDAPIQCSPPPMSVGELRRAIPAHCFQHSLVRSFAYLAADLLMSAALFVASTYIDTVIPSLVSFVLPVNHAAFTIVSFILSHVFWTLYWFAQGVVFTGLWVLGHECGHGGFASQSIVNDVVGFVVHSFLLVPFFSWKISHRRHHANTGSLEHDEVFVPEIVAAQQLKQLKLQVQHEHEDNYFLQLQHFAYRCFRLTFMLTFGWMGYLMFNLSSNQTYSAQGHRMVNHFFPSSPIFALHEQVLVLFSDIGMLAQLSLLVYLSSMYGVSNMVYFYLIPYMVNVAFLVLITYLQHTHVNVPHMNAQRWTWLSGALLTIDRDYGVLNFFHHHIADTHVCHHVFSQMPHYHAVEATQYLKAKLGAHYLYDQTPIVKALYTTYKQCVGVAADEKQPGVFWF